MCTRGDIQGIFLEIETRNWLGTIALNHAIQTTQGLPISVIDQQMNMEHQKYRKSFPPEKTWVFYVHVSWPRGSSGLHWASLPLVQWWFTVFLQYFGGRLFSLIQWIITIPMWFHQIFMVILRFSPHFQADFFLNPIAGRPWQVHTWPGSTSITRSWRWQESCWNLQWEEHVMEPSQIRRLIGLVLLGKILTGNPWFLPSNIGFSG